MKNKIEFSQKDVLEIVKKYLQNEGYNVSEIDIDFFERSEGYGMGEHNVSDFEIVAVVNK